MDASVSRETSQEDPLARSPQVLLSSGTSSRTAFPPVLLILSALGDPYGPLVP